MPNRPGALAGIGNTPLVQLSSLNDDVAAEQITAVNTARRHELAESVQAWSELN